MFLSKDQLILSFYYSTENNVQLPKEFTNGTKEFKKLDMQFVGI